MYYEYFVIRSNARASSSKKNSATAPRLRSQVNQLHSATRGELEAQLVPETIYLTCWQIYWPITRSLPFFFAWPTSCRFCGSAQHLPIPLRAGIAVGPLDRTHQIMRLGRRLDGRELDHR